MIQKPRCTRSSTSPQLFVFRWGSRNARALSPFSGHTTAPKRRRREIQKPRSERRQRRPSAAVDDRRIRLLRTATAAAAVAIARGGRLATARRTEQAGISQRARDQANRADRVVV